MNVRKATMEDFPQTIMLGFKEYLEEQSHILGLNFSYLHLHYAYKRLIENPIMGCLVVAEEDGVILGFYSAEYLPSSLDHNQVISTETGWYVDAAARGKGVGKALLKEATKIAYDLGIRMQRVSYPQATESGRSLGDWYQRLGYIPYETSAFKIISEEDF